MLTAGLKVSSSRLTGYCAHDDADAPAGSSIEGMASPAADASLSPAATPSRTNWAGNYRYTAAHHVEPSTTEEAAAVLASSGPIKAVGSRHSFNDIADSSGTQVALTHLKSMTLDRGRQIVTVGGGVTYGELAPWLDAQGFAVHNLASLPHISVAGACATATHGSGLGNGCLATAVAGLELLDGKGQRLWLRPATHPDTFRAAVVGMGACGIVLNTKLQVIPSFAIAQTVYEDLSFTTLESSLREIFCAAYSVSLFTDWQGHRATQAWVKRKVDAVTSPDTSPTFFGAKRQEGRLHPLPNLPAESCTEQLGIPGPWYERLPHFRLDFTPSAGAELQTEYFVPLDRGFEALLAVEQLRDRITPLLLISELRTIAGDDLPMSMAFQRESLAIHFTWKPDFASVLALLPRVEEALKPFAARPHWAKLFAVPPRDVRALYPEFASFKAQSRLHDPQGRFRNAFLNELLGE